MGKSLREKAILAMLGVIVLYAIAVLCWFMSAESMWKKSAKAYAEAQKKYQRECRLIGEKRKWTDAYEAEKAQMPTFAAGKATDTTWQRKIDDLAAKHHVFISSKQPGHEVEVGDVLELPVDVKSWEASLESLVRLMHELENTTDGMFDITQLNFRPSSRKGYLRGSLTLKCAYMREK